MHAVLHAIKDKDWLYTEIVVFTARKDVQSVVLILTAPLVLMDITYFKIIVMHALKDAKYATALLLITTYTSSLMANMIIAECANLDILSQPKVFVHLALRTVQLVALP